MGGVKVPQVPRGVGRRNGVSPSPLGEGSGEAPSHKFILYFLLKIPYFDAF